MFGKIMIFSFVNYSADNMENGFNGSMINYIDMHM